MNLLTTSKSLLLSTLLSLVKTLIYAGPLYDHLVPRKSTLVCQRIMSS